MNTRKLDFYKQLCKILQTQDNILFDGRGKTSEEIQKMYNEEFNDNKTRREIIGGLSFLAKKGITRKVKLGNVTYWRQTSKDYYDLVYET